MEEEKLSLFEELVLNFILFEHLHVLEVRVTLRNLDFCPCFLAVLYW